MRASILSALALMIVLAPAASAQTGAGAAAKAEAAAAPANEDGGIAFGLQLLSSFVGAEDRPDDAPEGAVYVEEVAPGFQIWLAYAYSPSFLLRLAFAGAPHSTDDPDVDVQVTSGMLEAVYSFPTKGNLRPYLFGGLGGFALRSLKDAFEFEADGGAVDLGAGVNYFVSRRVSFDLSARADFVNWDTTKATVELPGGDTITVETPVNESGTAGKIMFGIGVWF